MTAKIYVVCCLFAWLHPFHVSVCDIQYERDEQLLEVTLKIFADDLEQALSLKRDDPVRLSSPHIDQLISSYIHEVFQLKINEKQVSPRFLGWEQEEDAVWVYVESPIKGPLKNLEVKNTILTEVFDDQVNLVHLHVVDKTKSVQLAGDALVKRFKNIDKW